MLWTTSPGLSTSVCGIIGSWSGSVYSWMSRSCWIVRPGSERNGPLGADRRAELLQRVVLVGRDRDDLRVGHGELRLEAPPARGAAGAPSGSSGRARA